MTEYEALRANWLRADLLTVLEMVTKARLHLAAGSTSAVLELEFATRRLHRLIGSDDLPLLAETLAEAPAKEIAT